MNSITLEFIDTAHDAKVLQQERFSGHHLKRMKSHFSLAKSDPVASMTVEKCTTISNKMSINRSGYQDIHFLPILCKNPQAFFYIANNLL